MPLINILRLNMSKFNVVLITTTLYVDISILYNPVLDIIQTVQSVSQFEHSFLAEEIEGTTFLLPLRNCDKNGAHGSVKTADRI